MSVEKNESSGGLSGKQIKTEPCRAHDKFLRDSLAPLAGEAGEILEFSLPCSRFDRLLGWYIHTCLAQSLAAAGRH